jgi:tetratricopeptide (TPR) repeat protein
MPRAGSPARKKATNGQNALPGRRQFMRHLTLLPVLFLMVLTLGEHAIGTEAVPDNKSSFDTMTVAQLETAGDVARAQKDYEQAIKYFEAAIHKAPKNAVLYNKLGLAELKNGKLDTAQTNFQAALKRNPKYTDALNNIGAVKYMQKDFGGAAKQFKKAIAMDESRASFHVNLGAAWFGQKKLERAIAEYGRALALDPEALNNNSKAGVAAQIASPEERARFQYMLAKIYAQRGDA